MRHLGATKTVARLLRSGVLSVILVQSRLYSGGKQLGGWAPSSFSLAEKTVERMH